MKKFLSILFIFALLVFPFSANAEIPSPDMKSLIHIEPVIEFDYVDPYNTEGENNPLAPFAECNILKVNWDKYEEITLDEMIVLHLTQEYTNVEFTFPLAYIEGTDVTAVIATEKNYTYFINGIVTENGSVVFDLSYVGICDCVMLVFSSNEIKSE